LISNTVSPITDILLEVFFNSLLRNGHWLYWKDLIGY